MLPVIPTPQNSLPDSKRRERTAAVGAPPLQIACAFRAKRAHQPE